MSPVDSFLNGINVLQHARCILEAEFEYGLSSKFSRYKQLCPTTPQYHALMLEAQALGSQFHYDSSISSLPAIYVSSNPEELPIIIDTGASISISPLRSDFIAIHPPGLTSLNQVNGSTPVEGEGCLNWCIEDIHGKRVCLHTKGYHVPSASIRLFSPQCYIQERKGHAKLTLNSKGIDLTLGGGSVL